MENSINSSIKVRERNDKITFLCLAVIVFAFLCFLNAIFPTQSDDIGRKIGGVSAAINSYKSWNGRFGELLLVAFGSYFATTPWYAPLNALIGTCVVFEVFFVIFAHLPKFSVKDISIFAILFSFIMYDPVFSFGSVFYWAAGSFNYLLSWFLILLWIIPYRLFWQAALTKDEKSYSKKNHWLCYISVLSGFFAGWCSEFGIVLIVLQIALVSFAFIKKMKLPLWYYLGILSLCTGWLILYLCPGLRIRSKYFDYYASVIQLLKMGPIDLLRRIKGAYSGHKILYSENLVLFSVFLFLTSVLYKPSQKKFESTVVAFLVLGFTARLLSKVFILPCIIVICILCMWFIRKENEFLKNLFLCLAGAFIVEFIYIGATIQIGIPRRASFQYTLVNCVLIAINMHFCFAWLKDRIRIGKAACVCCIMCSLCFMSFVGLECYSMNRKWEKMEESISAQKSQGLTCVVVDKNTFASRYWGYGDWGNPGTNPDVWPNNTYANVYGVEKFIAE